MGWNFLAEPLISPTTDTFQAASSSSDGSVLQIRFNDAASVADISAALYDLEAKIIDGPSAIGLYRIEFSTEALREAALIALPERQDIVVQILEQ